MNSSHQNQNSYKNPYQKTQHLDVIAPNVVNMRKRQEESEMRRKKDQEDRQIDQIDPEQESFMDFQLENFVLHFVSGKICYETTNAVVIDVDSQALRTDQDEQQQQFRNKTLQNLTELQCATIRAQDTSSYKFEVIINPPKYCCEQKLNLIQQKKNITNIKSYINAAIQEGNNQNFKAISIPATLKSIQNLKPKTQIFETLFETLDEYDLSQESASGSLKKIRIVLEDRSERNLFETIISRMYIQRTPFSLMSDIDRKKVKEGISLTEEFPCKQCNQVSFSTKEKLLNHLGLECIKLRCKCCGDLFAEAIYEFHFEDCIKPKLQEYDETTHDPQDLSGGQFKQQYINIDDFKTSYWDQFEPSFCFSCSQNLGFDQLYVILHCSHLFHYECAERFLARSPNCPQCGYDQIRRAI
ncbi:UNKNOWN [Stylonychia lemnae]|uniref:RING-type domain-containing protein n=1 Tax=Stylonychia lemnae TaxID=5949 RepID=A0A078AJ66_STYLE|nr:UNKNOWN [Stylonychia lemnae]|eukprot:CDW82264.1 UNKNOWN [Stylonychia lemnae]